MGKLKVALQIWSIRDELDKDMDAALKAVKEMGYDYVEFGDCYKTGEEMAELLKKHDLKCVSIHQPHHLILENPEEKIAYFKAVGTKFVVLPHMGHFGHKGGERYEEITKEIIEVGKLLKENGIQFLYHNHDFEFDKYEGKFLLDWLFETIPEEYLQPEIDTCWVAYAGYDPSAYLRQYAGRLGIVHLKDFVCSKYANGPVYSLMGVDDADIKREADSDFAFRPIGQGVQNFPEILKACEECGAEYVSVEQDMATTASQLESARQSREYLKSLGL